MTRAAVGPRISVVVANYNGAAHLDACLASLLRQTLQDIEVIVVDDASTDDSVAKVTAVAARDSRIRLLRNLGAKGPAGARNTAISAATGEWIAIVDSDDMVYARRFEQLIERAEADQADIVADDLLVFEDERWSAHRFLEGSRRAGPTWVTPEAFLDENHLFPAVPNLGVLKPVIRREALASTRYDESLRIAEDFDLILRLLQCGARYRIYPEPTYLYRKHPASVSRELLRPDIEKMMSSHAALVADRPDMPPGLARAFSRRYASLERAAAFTDLVTALKARRLAEAWRLACRHPRASLLLRLPLAARLGRLRPRPKQPLANRRPSCCIVSRQRIIGPTNGSSTYLLAVASAIRELGVDVHLLQPSPTVLGRWPVLVFRREMRVFKSVRIRGALAVGDLRIARDPRIFVAALLTVLGSVAAKIGWRPPWLQIPPAPYAIGAPWTAADLLYVARHAPAISDVVVFDYAFQTVASPYILREAPIRFTVMHDLFSSRHKQFTAAGATDSVGALDEGFERLLLSGADVTIAIQKDEAAYVAGALPGHRVITSMMPVTPVAAAQPGDGERVLFVGSSAAANVSGLAWFLDKVWPLVLQRRPQAQLLVAGSVGRAVGMTGPNVQVLGVVPDLSKLYREAGVVISPLRAGSGLKIKLVEALAQGKAIVATSTTLQGVVEEVGGAVLVDDQPEGFAGAVISLLEDVGLRRRHAELALQAAAANFSQHACMGALRAVIKDSLTRSTTERIKDSRQR